jgi:hypothetical protein
MARSDVVDDTALPCGSAASPGQARLVLRRVKRAYEVSHLGAAARAVIVAGFLVLVAIGLYRVTRATYVIAVALAVTMAVLAWRGGAWRRGAFAGVLAGLPPLVIPSIAWTLSSNAGHCNNCEVNATLPCLVACFATGSLVGILVGYRATSDNSPRRFGLAAIATAALGGLLGCGTTGLGGAIGVVVGLVIGGVAGWIVAGRTAHA